MPSGLWVAIVEATTPAGFFPLRLGVDTGADRTVIEEGVVRSLGLSTRTGSPVTGVGGRLATRSATVPKLSLDGRERANIEVAVVPLPWNMLVDGLLGLDFLGAGRLELDFDAGTISLS